MEELLDDIRRERLAIECYYAQYVNASPDDRGLLLPAITARKTILTELLRIANGGLPALNKFPHRVLGDDHTGPHSSAIIIGHRTVLACAHSLSTINPPYATAPYTYIEDYWVQPSVTVSSDRQCNIRDRVPIKLFKFNVENDWALFVRADGKYFTREEIVAIETSPITRNINAMEADVIHCPVAFGVEINNQRKFKIGWHQKSVRIQDNSEYHVKYEGKGLVTGSSGGGLYLRGSTAVFAMHVEAIAEDEYDADESVKTIAYTDKRVRSGDGTYGETEDNDPPLAKKSRVDSEPLASLAGGKNGMGSAMIICKFPRLMHYIAELEK